MITLISWGHKYGVPIANFKFDVSFLPNPWRQEKLKGAKKKELTAYMEKQEGFTDLVNAFSNLIATYDELYPGEDMRFAFCCSAGEYRSVIMVECVALALSRMNMECKREHPFAKI